MKIKKLIALVMIVAMLFSLSACSGNGNGGSGSKDNNTPKITGVADQTVEAGSQFDALAGVTASDDEDGDLTGKIVIESSPALEFENGKAVPPSAGSYELIYSVTDKDGAKGEAYATLTVTRQTGEAVVYKTFDFSTQAVTDNCGWEAQIGEAASATAELKEGAYVITINSPGEGDGDVRLSKSGFVVKPAEYHVRVWAKSTENTYAHLLARDEGSEEWSTFGGQFNLPIGPEIAPLDLYFTSDKDGSAELMLNLGKITPNPENASDTTPENFIVTIDKIEIYEITGEETLTPTFTADFASPDALVVEAGDGAAATAEAQGAVKIDSYPTEGGIWSIKASVVLNGQTIEAGNRYYYSFVLTSESAQSGECLVESLSQYDGARANFNAFSANAGEPTVISGIFTAESSVQDPVIRLQIGNPSDGVTANTLAFSDVVFGTVEGDKDVQKSIDRFIAFGNGTYNAENPEYPWTTFNGTDEDNERGVGTIWTEDGHFFYRIDNGGNVDWHNKLICGYGENPLTLEADSYYTIEITAKATKDVSCGLFLNPIGGWDPRITERLDLTTAEQTFSFTTTDTFITDMNFELLFQFGSDATASLGEVTIEISNITIYQMKVM